MKRAALYVRVSQDSQTVENQLLALNEVAQRSGWAVVHVFADEGISGAKGRDKRPGYDGLLKAVARHEVQIRGRIWSVDRLGRSLSDLVTDPAQARDRGDHAAEVTPRLGTRSGLRTFTPAAERR